MGGPFIDYEESNGTRANSNVRVSRASVGRPSSIVYLGVNKIVNNDPQISQMDADADKAGGEIKYRTFLLNLRQSASSVEIVLPAEVIDT